MSTRPRLFGRNLPLLVAGLLLPGGGLLIQRRWLDAALCAVGASFVILCGFIDFVVSNRMGYPAPMRVFTELATLPAPMRVAPTFPVALLYGLTIHLTAAWLAARPATAQQGAEPRAAG